MIQFDRSQLLPPLRHIWREGICMGRAFELLRADGQAHLAEVQRAMGYRYCRFHGLFHDEMAVAVRLPDGRVAYQWQQIDKLLDFLLSIGLRPFLELGPMPKALASGHTEFFQWRMNVTPPSDFEEWGALVGALARHCVARYGLDEVHRWRFEVWNEPNLAAFWTGTQEDYWKLYAHAANALKQVDAGLSVGGPASAEAGWIEDFLRFARSTGTPVDFVSTHAYPQNEFADYATRQESPHRPGRYFGDVVRRVRSQAQGLPVYWTEWSSLDADSKANVDWYANDTIDRLGAGACAVRNCVELDSDAEGLFWWVASDVFEEMGLPHAPFANSYGLVTPQGVPKASFRAFELLRQMTGSRLKAGFEPPHEGAGVLACLEGEVLRVLLWNRVPPGLDHGTWRDSVALPSSRGCLASSLRLEVGAGSAYEAWLAAGEPQNLTPIQETALRALATPAASFFCMQDEAFDFELAPGEVLLLEVSGPPDPKIEKGVDPQTGSWNEALNVDDRT